MKTVSKITTVAIVLITMSSILLSQGNVGINSDNSAPDNSAMLDVKSTTMGLLPPRMTTAQRNAIDSPADGLMIFNINTGCLNYYFSGNWFEWCGILNPQGTIESLNCAASTISGTLIEGVAASGVSASVSYTGGNGGWHLGQIVPSTGVTGLAATTSADNFGNGNGILDYVITGTPLSAGTASFALNIGGQTCDLEIPVIFICGTSIITYTYNGSSVNYGTVTSANNRCWLDRNLGASQVANSSTDAAAYGHLFQWGRLDDSHQVRTSPTTTILSNSDVPGHGNFIIGMGNPWDWRSPQNNNLWQGVNGINNPCPAGYRLPTQAEWETERLSWSSNNSAGAFSSPLKLPMTGYRHCSSGSVINEGSFGCYWSCDHDNNTSWRLGFTSSSASFLLNVRAMGNTVRCIKD